jgi:alpha-mannosidase
VWLDSEARSGPPALAEAAHIASRAAVESADALAVLAHAAGTRGAGTPIVAFNPLPWSRHARVEIADANALVVDADGKPALGQDVAGGGRAFAVDVPSLGWAVLHVRRAAKDESPRSDSPLRVDGWTVSNAALMFRVDPATGNLASVRVLGSDVELLAQPAALGFASDEPAPRIESVEMVERGPVRALVRIARSTPRVRVIEEIALEGHARHIDFRAHVEPLDDEARVRATFAPAHLAEQPWVSVPFGVAPIHFGRKPGTARAHSEFDAAAPPDASEAERNWPLGDFVLADDAAGGFALVNGTASRFAFDGAALSIMLCEPGSAGAKPAARDTEWSLFPYAGAGRRSAAATEAAERAREVVLVATDLHDGARPAQGSFLRMSRLTSDGGLAEGAAAGVAISSFQATDEGDGWIVRFVEQRGESARLRLEFDRPAFNPERVDLLGNSLGPVKAEEGRLELPIGAWRVETLRVRLRP